MTFFTTIDHYGAPKRATKCGLTKINATIEFATLRIYASFQLTVVILLQMVNCDPSPSPFDTFLTLGGLENSVLMKNHSGYEAILKKTPYVYQKPLRN